MGDDHRRIGPALLVALRRADRAVAARYVPADGVFGGGRDQGGHRLSAARAVRLGAAQRAWARKVPRPLRMNCTATAASSIPSTRESTRMPVVPTARWM